MYNIYIYNIIYIYIYPRIFQPFAFQFTKLFSSFTSHKNQTPRTSKHVALLRAEFSSGSLQRKELDAARKDVTRDMTWVKRDTPRMAMWVCLKIVYPYTQWFIIIIPAIIGGIPHFQTYLCNDYVMVMEWLFLLISVEFFDGLPLFWCKTKRIELNLP